MGTNFTRLLVGLLLSLNKENTIKKLVQESNKTLAAAFNSIFIYIYEVLYLHNSYSFSYVNSLYPSELEKNKYTS